MKITSFKLLPPARCHILRLKCAKIDFGWVCAADLAAGAYRAPQTPS